MVSTILRKSVEGLRGLVLPRDIATITLYAMRDLRERVCVALLRPRQA